MKLISARFYRHFLYFLQLQEVPQVFLAIKLETNINWKVHTDYINKKTKIYNFLFDRT